MERNNDKPQNRCFLIFLDGWPYLMDRTSADASVAIWKEQEHFERIGEPNQYERFSAIEVVDGFIRADELQDMMNEIRESRAKRHKKKVIEVIQLIAGLAFVAAIAVIAYLWD